MRASTAARRSAAACSWPRRSAAKAALRSPVGSVLVIGSWLLPWALGPVVESPGGATPGDFGVGDRTAPRPTPVAGAAARADVGIAMPARRAGTRDRVRVV